MAEGDGICWILSLDGGGAKGFYTLGILHEVAAVLPRPFHETFDLIYGTSTGAVIAALLALGKSVNEIHDLYRTHVPEVMGMKCRSGRSRKLHEFGSKVFCNKRFDEAKTGIGIVATRWKLQTPMIFKNKIDLAYGRKGTFVPGFGCEISEAVEASCSAYPFFERKKVTTSYGENIELIDGGFCANNPTLYALSDAMIALGHEAKNCRILSLGCGQFPESRRNIISRLIRGSWPITLLQKTLEVNTLSMDKLRMLLFRDVRTVRIDGTFNQPYLATDFLENDLEKLDLLWQQGRESFGNHEAEFRELILGGE